MIQNLEQYPIVRNEIEIGWTPEKLIQFEQNIVNSGEVKLEIKSKVIPPHLKDKFISEVGTEPDKITEKMIDDFLEKYDTPKPFDNNRLREILAKNKDVEDRISKIEKHDSVLKQMIKESKYGK